MSFPDRSSCIRAAGGAVLALLVCFATPSFAGDEGACDTVADVGSKVWNVAGPAVKAALSKAGPHGATAATALKLIEEGIQLWNKISGDGWAKVGPRRLDFGQWSEGTIIGSTERLFLSGIPAVNPVTVDFHKLDHDGEVKVVVCKLPEKGKAILVKSFMVEPGAQNGKIATVEISAAKGHIITVALHGKSVAKSLKYKVRASMLYDDATAASGSR